MTKLNTVVRSSTRLAAAAAFIAFGLSTPAFAIKFTGAGGALEDATADEAGVITESQVEFGPITATNIPLTGASIRSVTLTGLTHTWIGDNVIFLVNEDGSKLGRLTSPPDNDGSNFNGTYTFLVDATLPTVDEALVGKASAYDLPGGRYAMSRYGGGTDAGARTDFSAFTPDALNDNYYLEIADFYPGDTGALTSWSMSFTTIPGDASDDGRVNFDDLIILAQHYNQTSGQYYETGDFTGDHKVNFDDLIVLAQNYNKGAPLLTAGATAGLSAEFTQDWARALSLVPEPTSLLALAATSALVTRRRRA